MGSLSLLQRIFGTQESNWGLLHCRQSLYQLSYQGSPLVFFTSFDLFSYQSEVFRLHESKWLNVFMSYDFYEVDFLKVVKVATPKGKVCLCRTQILDENLARHITTVFFFLNLSIVDSLCCVSFMYKAK